MKTILLALLTNSFMGVYDSPKACQLAIFKIYETKLSMQTTDKVVSRKVVQSFVESQREFVCVSQQ